jgi:hypothetical protein
VKQNVTLAFFDIFLASLLTIMDLLSLWFDKNIKIIKKKVGSHIFGYLAK